MNNKRVVINYNKCSSHVVVKLQPFWARYTNFEHIIQPVKLKGHRVSFECKMNEINTRDFMSSKTSVQLRILFVL